MAVTLTPYIFESLSLFGRSLRLVWRSCQFLDFLHSIGLRCVDGFLIEVLNIEIRHKIYGTSVWANLSLKQTLIHTPPPIAQTPIFSLRCVYALQGRYLRAVVARFADSIYTMSEGCVKLTLETLTLSGLSDEHPTDWVKSD